MAKKVFIGVGHGGSDPGVVKFVRKADGAAIEAGESWAGLF